MLDGSVFHFGNVVYFWAENYRMNITTHGIFCSHIGQEAPRVKRSIIYRNYIFHVRVSDVAQKTERLAGKYNSDKSRDKKRRTLSNKSCSPMGVTQYMTCYHHYVRHNYIPHLIFCDKCFVEVNSRTSTDESGEEITDEQWKLIHQNAEKYHEEK